MIVRSGVRKKIVRARHRPLLWMDRPKNGDKEAHKGEVDVEVQRAVYEKVIHKRQRGHPQSVPKLVVRLARGALRRRSQVGGIYWKQRKGR